MLMMVTLMITIMMTIIVSSMEPYESSSSSKVIDSTLQQHPNQQQLPRHRNLVIGLHDETVECSLSDELYRFRYDSHWKQYVLDNKNDIPMDVHYGGGVHSDNNETKKTDYNENDSEKDNETDSENESGRLLFNNNNNNGVKYVRKNTYKKTSDSTVILHENKHRIQQYSLNTTTTSKNKNYSRTDYIYGRHCWCADFFEQNLNNNTEDELFSHYFCSDELDTCIVSKDGSNPIQCYNNENANNYATSNSNQYNTKVNNIYETIRSYWPIIVMWYIGILIIFGRNDIGKYMYQYIRRKIICCRRYKEQQTPGVTDTVQEQQREQQLLQEEEDDQHQLSDNENNTNHRQQRQLRDREITNDNSSVRYHHNSVVDSVMEEGQQQQDEQNFHPIVEPTFFTSTNDNNDLSNSNASTSNNDFIININSTSHSNNVVDNSIAPIPRATTSDDDNNNMSITTSEMIGDTNSSNSNITVPTRRRLWNRYWMTDSEQLHNDMIQLTQKDPMRAHSIVRHAMERDRLLYQRQRQRNFSAWRRQRQSQQSHGRSLWTLLRGNLQSTTFHSTVNNNNSNGNSNSNGNGNSNSIRAPLPVVQQVTEQQQQTQQLAQAQFRLVLKTRIYRDEKNEMCDHNTRNDGMNQENNSNYDDGKDKDHIASSEPSTALDSHVDDHHDNNETKDNDDDDIIVNDEYVDYDDDDVNDERGGIRCAICLLYLNDGDIIGNIPCGHMLHKDCLKDWLRRKNRCPLCQQTGIAAFEDRL